jgi:hypothetical protein
MLLSCSDGYTALMFAARGGYESTVRLLVQWTASLTARDKLK